MEAGSSEPSFFCVSGEESGCQTVLFRTEQLPASDFTQEKLTAPSSAQASSSSQLLEVQEDDDEECDFQVKKR